MVPPKRVVGPLVITGALACVMACGAVSPAPRGDGSPSRPPSSPSAPPTDALSPSVLPGPASASVVDIILSGAISETLISKTPLTCSLPPDHHGYLLVDFTSVGGGANFVLHIGPRYDGVGAYDATNLQGEGGPTIVNYTVPSANEGNIEFDATHGAVAVTIDSRELISGTVDATLKAPTGTPQWAQSIEARGVWSCTLA